MEIKKENVKKQNTEPKPTSLTKMTKKNKIALLVIAVFLLLGLLVYRNKSLLVVAKVNGKYIYTWELKKLVWARYSQPALEDLITEKLITDELAKNNIKVSEEELNARITEIEGTLGGQSLEEALALQNVTLTEFRNQMKMRIGVDKLLESQVTTTDAEIDEFIKNYGDTLVGPTDEEKRKEAEEQLKAQKIGDALNTWLADLKAKSTVINYL